MRWQIDAGFEMGKGACGLDECEVRTWDAWHRHITLALLAHAMLVVRQAQVRKWYWRNESVTARRTGSAAVALSIGVGTSAEFTAYARMVTLAPRTSNARQTLSRRETLDTLPLVIVAVIQAVILQKA